MKKLLLVTVVTGGLMFAGTTRSDAQVYFSIGFGPGYYGYYSYGYYYPCRSAQEMEWRSFHERSHLVQRQQARPSISGRRSLRLLPHRAEPE